MNTDKMAAEEHQPRDLTNFRGNADPVARVLKLGYVAFETPDVERLTAFYTDALGFAVTAVLKDSAYLTTGGDHHCVVVTKGEKRARTRVGFEMCDSIDDVEHGLAMAGIEYKRQADPEPGIAEGILIEEPGGTPLQLYAAQSQGAAPDNTGVCPAKLGHVASHVTNLSETQGFYEDVLGFKWSDTIGDFFAFMRCSPAHHTMNFLSHPDEDGRTSGLHHIAYDARDLGHFRDILDNLARHDVVQVWGPGRHGPGHNIAAYHRDPDNNRIEVSTELDLIFDEKNGCFEPRPWHEDKPQRPKVWTPGVRTRNRWGTAMPF